MHRNLIAATAPCLAVPLYRRRIGAAAIACVVATLNAVALSAQAAAIPSTSLASMSLDELASIQITSVSKKSEPLADAAASVFVITNEDIRRSGAANLREALRLAPNLQVAQVDAQSYAISARGFNSTTANKLLVLIDGRTVYTPLYSGVFWDAQDVMLEDIERIEVISGPGGTLWGTNAVDGVINVITRSSADTQGGLLTAGGGNREKDTGFRYGGAMGNEGHYRIYGEYFDRNHTSTAAGAAVPDGWNKAQAGFRTDWGGSDHQFTMQGDVYRADLDQRLQGGEVSGLNLMSRWNHKLADDSSVNLLAYYDRTERNFPGTYHETLDLVDIQFQHTLQPIGAHSIVWGASYRHGSDQEDNSSMLAFLPAHLGQTWASLFAQDDIELPHDLRFIVGTRFSHNDYTGWEILPNARLAWKISPDNLLWASFARAVRTPSRIDRDFYAPSQPPYLLTGNTSFRSEVANVAELGYRTQATKTLSFSITGFHADYDRLRSIEHLPSGAYVIANQMEGTTSGIEAWGTYQALPSWRLAAGFSALRERLRLLPGSTDPTGISGAGNDPAHSWQLRSTWDIASGREFDLTLRHVGALPKPDVPSYNAVDLRFGWKLRPDLDLSLAGQNLGARHAEFGSLPARSEIVPTVFARVLWRV